MPTPRGSGGTGAGAPKIKAGPGPGGGRSVGERVVVGMSGGVDSSVAAALLVEQGYDVVGVTLRVWPWAESDEPANRFGSCCSPQTVDDARQVARALGIPHYLLNTAREFDGSVIENFAAEYRAGRTPVPCVVCNRDIKFGSLLRRAEAWEARAVATGHYARITRDERSGRYLLWRGCDSRKDQSDFLWPLSQTQLAAARFPVGDLMKERVREHARRLGLVTADKPESQEICFVPDNDYRGFLRRRDPTTFRRGAILEAGTGRPLGRHDGLANFTIGQRKGLGLASGRSLYVVDLDADSNSVVVGEAEALEQVRLVATHTNFISCLPPTEPLRVQARIRHNHAPAPATVRAIGDDRMEVVFDTPQRAITPGQSVVLYDGDRVVGGGVIARQAA
jgi:tRNA-uridine 2-sulfurtransferase